MVDELIAELYRRIEEIEEQVSRQASVEIPTGGGGGAPNNAQYILVSLDATLTDDRVIDPGDGLAGTDGGPGGSYTLDLDLKTAGGLDIYSGKLGVDVSDFAGAGLEGDGSEKLRIAPAAGGVGLTGGGGVALDLDINGLSEEATPDGGDFVAIYDQSNSVIRKQSRNDFLTGTSGADTGIKVKNSSGATASVNDVGYIDDNGEYQTTTTAQDDVAWCVVTTGGADGADIWVARRGRVTVAYTGTAPSQGDYLVTSATAGSAQQQTTMRPEVFAVCVEAGAGGVVKALLLTTVVSKIAVESNELVRVNNASDSDFVSTISGTPSGSTLSYGTVTSGDEQNIDVGANLLAKLVLHNTTRGDDALIDSVDTGTNTITLTDSVPGAWASGDDITIRSQTNTDVAGVTYFVDWEFTGGVDELAAWFIASLTWRDSSTGQRIQITPYESYAAGKVFAIFTQAANTNNIVSTPPIALNSKRFCLRWNASGSGSGRVVMRLFAEGRAAP